MAATWRRGSGRSVRGFGKLHYRDFVTPETRSAFGAAFHQVLSEGQEGSAECELLCRDGSRLPVAIQATNREQALQVAERLRKTVTTTPARVGLDSTADGTLSYSASLGVSLVKAGEASLKPAVKRADQGLYAAKQAGRNRVHWEEA